MSTGSRCLGNKTSRLLRGVLIVYLLAVLGYLAPTHHHDLSEAGNSQSECQLCQISGQAAIQPDLPVITFLIHFAIAEFPPVVAPALPFRHSPSASRAPPRA